MKIPANEFEEITLNKVIGDISIHSDSNFAYIKVDKKTKICIPRKNSGLDYLVESLKSLIK